MSEDEKAKELTVEEQGNKERTALMLQERQTKRGGVGASWTTYNEAARGGKYLSRVALRSGMVTVIVWYEAIIGVDYARTLT